MDKKTKEAINFLQRVRLDIKIRMINNWAGDCESLFRALNKIIDEGVQRIEKKAKTE